MKIPGMGLVDHLAALKDGNNALFDPTKAETNHLSGARSAPDRCILGVG